MQRPLVVYGTGRQEDISCWSLEKLKGKEHTGSVKARFLMTDKKQDLESSGLEVTSSSCRINFVLIICQLTALPNIWVEGLPYSMLSHWGSSSLQWEAGAFGGR